MNTKYTFFAATLGLAVWMTDHRAEACGGCFQPAITQTPTVVTDHRMVFSISKGQSTLYDQIRYTGEPESFAWVLPYSGTIKFGLSSDALFQTLDANSTTVIQAPPSSCPPPPFCGSSSGGASSGFGGSTSNDGGVTILSREVVGPYDKVELKADDPAALDKWLEANGYGVPESVKPTVAAYQAAHFNFVAIKLAPGKGVTDMRPVRVTTLGSNVALPLRMVAAGAGAKVGITLWVVSEGRYEPQNFNSFVIKSEELTWDWAVNSSDYTKLRDAKTAASNGRAWEVESSVIYSPEEIKYWMYYGSPQVFQQDAYDDVKTDAGAVTQSAAAARDEDLDILTAGLEGNKVFLTRLRADLAVSALDQDLLLTASATQEPLGTRRIVTNAINTPQCPTYSPCPSSSGLNGASGANGASPENDDGCRTSPGNASMPWVGAVVALMLAGLSRKRGKNK